MPSQVRSVVALALLYVFRMLGLFMVLPILVLYGEHYRGATPFLLGLALGIYGLSQALLQIPLGLLSDILGRKPVIIGGLTLFALGSVVAATASSVEGLIIGRALQGSGAIASAIMALVADLTSEENRSKAMAAIGASIGLSFSLAMIIGPAVAAFAGLGGVFALSALLALAGIAIVVFVVPTPSRHGSHRDSGALPDLLWQTAKDPQLLRLDFGIFTLHAVLMASFVAIPILFDRVLGLDRAHHWQVYLPLLSLAFVAMLPLMVIAEKKRQIKAVFLLAVSVLAASLFALSVFSGAATWVLSFVFLFFVAFNLLEAQLPSLVSKLCHAGAKGTAMGLYSTSQFLGAFCGGVTGGWLVQHVSLFAVFEVCGLMAALWLALALFMKAPKYLTSVCVNVNQPLVDLRRVLQLKGVEEALYDPRESLLYLKVDRKYLNELDLRELTGCA